ASAEDARARGGPVVGRCLPEVRHRKGTRVEHVRGPAPLRVAAVIGSGLDEADRPLRLLAQPSCQHAARRPAANDEDIEALGHRDIVFNATMCAAAACTAPVDGVGSDQSVSRLLWITDARASPESTLRG